MRFSTSLFLALALPVAAQAMGPSSPVAYTLKCKGDGYLGNRSAPLNEGPYEADVRFYQQGNPDVFVVGFAGAQRYFPQEVSSVTVERNVLFVKVKQEYTNPRWAAGSTELETLAFASPVNPVKGSTVKASLSASVLDRRGARRLLTVPAFSCQVK